MKQLKDLTLEELKKVYNINSKLREDVFNDMVENTDFWISEYLGCFENSAMDYRLDVSGYYNYLTIKNNCEFIDGLKTLQYKFCLLNDSSNDIINRADELLDRLDYYSLSLSEYDYLRLNDRINELVDELKTMFYNCIRDDYDSCYNPEYQLEYFLSFYSCERMSDSFYINDDYILYEHIEYNKCYE